MRPYRLLEHTADIRLRIYGTSLRGLFQNAVWALTDTLCDAKSVQGRKRRVIRIRGGGPEHLLVLLLKEVLFLFDGRRFLSRRLAIQKFDDKILEGAIYGEKVAAHPLKTEIKAVTYHGLKVEKKRGRWVAEVVLDV